jgi:hypothetical protein
MIARTEQPNAEARAKTSLEQAISQSLANMRQLAADSGTDDYWENSTKEVMDRRPLVFVVVVLDGQTFSWLMEPEDEPTRDGVLHTATYHLRGATQGGICDPGDAGEGRKTMPIETILHGVNWLVRDLTGEFLTEG